MIDAGNAIFKDNVPQKIREISIEALSYYPELNNHRIEFVINDKIRKSVMQAQPKFVTMLGFSSRSYLIKISKCFKLKGKSIPIEQLPEDVLLGWIGHELGHVMDYTHKNTWSMILFGIGYLTSKSFIISAERAADTYAVNHGLGEYILKTKDFILNQAGMSPRYLDKINRLYVPPEEVMMMMEDIGKA